MSHVLKTLSLIALISCTSVSEDLRYHYTLKELNGRKFEHASFTGFYSLVYFGFARCESECPLALHKMHSLASALRPGKRAKLKMYFVSIDPENDSPESIRERLLSAGEGIIGIRGEIREVQSMAKIFRHHFITARKGEYPSHSDTIYLVGPQGELLRTFGSGDSMKTLISILEELIHE